MMGVQTDGTLNGISILEISETPGLGMQAEAVLAPQFAGKQADSFTFTKTGAALDNEIDAISGATVTTKAVTNAVNTGLPSNVNLAAAEIELIGVEKKEYILKNEVDWIKDQYDFIIIDCPPSLNALTINALTTADSVLVPIQCEYYALEGLSQLIHTVNLVKERLNPGLDMEGVVFTMFDSRTNLSMQVVENVKSHLNQTVYETMIPRNIRLAEAPSYGMPIHMYDPKSAGAEAYMNLADEVIKHNKRTREFCVRRTVEHMGVTEEVAHATITQTDKFRADYYQYYTHGNYWTNPVNYDMTLNSEKVGVKNCVKLIEQYLIIKGFITPDRIQESDT